jgi:hypothetical protein
VWGFEAKQTSFLILGTTGSHGAMAKGLKTEATTIRMGGFRALSHVG